MMRMRDMESHRMMMIMMMSMESHKMMENIKH